MLGITAGTHLAFLGGYCSHLQVASWHGLEMMWMQICVCGLTLQKVAISVLLKGDLIQVRFGGD